MQLNFNIQTENDIPLILLNNNKRSKELNTLPDDYVLVDTETTGLNPAKDSLIELSALRVRNNEVCAEFSSLIKPLSKIPPFISSLTGITDDDVKNANDVKTVLYEFCNFLQNDIIVGHNVKFDLSFLNNNLISVFGMPLSNDYADTLYFARKKYSNLSSCKLTKIAEYLNIETKNAHRALNDCYMTFYVIRDLKKD